MWCSKEEDAYEASPNVAIPAEEAKDIFKLWIKRLPEMMASAASTDVFYVGCDAQLPGVSGDNREWALSELSVVVDVLHQYVALWARKKFAAATLHNARSNPSENCVARRCSLQ